MTRGIPKQNDPPEETPIENGEPVEKSGVEEAKSKSKSKSKPAGEAEPKSQRRRRMASEKPAEGKPEAQPAAYGPSPAEKSEKPEKQTGPDPFDPSKFRYDPQHTEDLTKRVFTEGQITVRKPNDQEWFRVRPGPEWQLPASILLLKHDKKYRLIAPAIAPAVRTRRSR